MAGLISRVLRAIGVLCAASPQKCVDLSRQIVEYLLELAQKFWVGPR